MSVSEKASHKSQKAVSRGQAITGEVSISPDIRQIPSAEYNAHILHRVMLHLRDAESICAGNRPDSDTYFPAMMSMQNRGKIIWCGYVH
jgi:hypothetical protein